MRLIPNITEAPRQVQTIILADGTSFEFEIYFMPLQQGWFIEYLRYLDFELKGFRICNFPNILNQFRNLIPFGLTCRSSDGREPSLQEDFVSGHTQLFLLDEAEVEEVARSLSEEI